MLAIQVGSTNALREVECSTHVSPKSAVTQIKIDPVLQFQRHPDKGRIVFHFYLVPL